MSNKINKIAQEVIDTKISFKDASAILRDAGNLPPDRRDFFNLLSIAIAQYQTKKISTARRCRIVFAFTERLRCANQLLDHQQMKAWRLDSNSDDGSFFINEAVIKTLCFCPLKHDKKNDQLFFDPSDFFALALKESENGGRA